MVILEDVIISAAITCLAVSINGYVMFKIGKNNIKKELFDFIASDKCSKIVYQMGAIAAQGAKTGFGLQKTGGKFTFEGLLAQIAGRFIESKWPAGQSQQQQTEETKLNIS